jgi:bacitracin transport system permease protein
MPGASLKTTDWRNEMFTALVHTELIKYKRTVLPWMIGIGGFLTAGTALLFVSTENSQVNWNILAVVSLNCINILALLLTSVFTGYVFICEYHQNTAGILFTYPLSKFRIYLIKYFVILILVTSLYLIFFLSVMLFGFLGIGNFPPVDFLLKFLKIILIMSVMNFVLVPVTALISIIIKGIGTYIFVGMGYFLVYISLINSDYSLFIPTCIPAKLVSNYYISEYISKSDFCGIIIISAVTFLSAFFIGAVYYSKSDVYKQSS